ncbi:MAG: hypothetical protein NUV91_02755 [Candidatus Omnitrophica bacterium]|nr:hypothetical protein [Candidatus Omnitrophota bacterium]
MRNLSEVLDQLIANSQDEDLTIGFKSVKNSLRYAAPEREQFWWSEVQADIWSHVKDRFDKESQILVGLEKWEIDMMKIWNPEVDDSKFGES